MEKIKIYTFGNLDAQSAIISTDGKGWMRSWDVEAKLQELLLRLQREAISMQENGALIEMEKVEQIFAELGIEKGSDG